MPASPGKGGLRSPVDFAAGPSPPGERGRNESVSSDSSDSSQIAAPSIAKRPPNPQPFARPAPSPFGRLQTASATNLHSFSRPAVPRPLHDLPLRQHSNSPATEPSAEPVGRQIGHRPRQHSQGFFEPSLPTASSSNAQAMAHLTASQIAAQAAMQVQNPHHIRKRSMTIPDPAVTNGSAVRLQPTSPPPPVANVNTSSANALYQNGILGGSRAAAATAASAAFPRSPLHPTGLPSDYAPVPVLSEREQKPIKEKSKMKLFSKPKSIAIIKDKDSDRKHPALPSPNKMGMHSAVTLPRFMNASTTSLVDPSMSSASSLYSSANASTSTLVPIDKTVTFEKEKDKHKHHFLSRPKKKDKDDHFHLPLSSASSTSRPTDPSAPQPLYSFAAPASPGHSSTFAKSMSGLDLRHGGRALRDRKKEEKAAASSLAPIVTSTSTLEVPFRDRDQSDWASPGSYGATIFGPSTAGPAVPHPSDYSSLAVLGATFGLPGMGPDDAWPLLKARLLYIFEGEDPRPPIEDFNALVGVHIRRCMQRQAPHVLIEDLRELLHTGFASLDQTLRHVPDERLVPQLVEMWSVVFNTILPFMQAVFLPLDLEFKGRGSLMSAREAVEFWGAAMPADPTSPVADRERNRNIPTLGEELDVRRITLLTFRDTVILPRHDVLTAIFSRLSLESISAGVLADPPLPLPPPPPLVDPARPGSARSAEAAPGSFNSQSSTLLDSASMGAASSGSLGARSRATSNTSAGSFHSVQSPPPPPPQTVGMVGGAVGQQQPARAVDSARVTETAGRMLQCVSVLASVQSRDEAQRKTERLSKELKYNWLGRGRTGRQRRGFVGTRVGRGVVGVA